MTNEEVIQRLRSAPNLKAISDATNIPYASLWRVAKGQEPRVSVVDELRVHFEQQPQ